MTLEPKSNLRRADPKNYHICNERGCDNIYTPYVARNGDRFCLEHGTK